MSIKIWQAVNKVYCHTTYRKIIQSNNEWIDNSGQHKYIKNNWYTIYGETINYYVIYGSYIYFYKTDFPCYVSGINGVFSDYFYTEQEYNRIKSLNELLNE